jgi:hypothetical protein
MLKDWAITYVKNKDIFHRRISEISDHGDYFVVTNKDESHIVFFVKEEATSFNDLIPRLKELQSKHKADRLTLIVYNTEINLKSLILNWGLMANFNTLTIIFSNPETNEKWIISPHVHNKIADPKSLDLGLRTMFESVSSWS